MREQEDSRTVDEGRSPTSSGDVSDGEESIVRFVDALRQNWRYTLFYTASNLLGVCLYFAAGFRLEARWAESWPLTLAAGFGIAAYWFSLLGIFIVGVDSDV